MKITLNRRWRIGGWTAIASAATNAAAGAAQEAVTSMPKTASDQAAAFGQPAGGGFMGDVNRLLQNPNLKRIADLNAQGGGNAFGAMPMQQQQSLDWLSLLQS